MRAPISLRLDDDVPAELAAQARARGVGLSTLLRDIAAQAARASRRARIRAASEAVARHLQTSADAASFYDFWGTPGADCAKPTAYRAADLAAIRRRIAKCVAVRQ
jgi:post-segregation antitoxin (ccd killing protein)